VAISKFESYTGRKADDREPGNPVAEFRVRPRFASAPRNDEVDVRCDVIDFMESLY
jgi:hypothetical protein